MGNQMHKDKKPKNLNELLQTTRFTEDEIIAWYKTFLQVNVRGTYSAIKESPMLEGTQCCGPN